MMTFLRCINFVEKTVYFFISGIHCQQPQYIRARPNDTEDGQNVEFQCHVDNKAGTVHWKKDGFLLGNNLCPFFAIAFSNIFSYKLCKI